MATYLCFRTKDISGCYHKTFDLLQQYLPALALAYLVQHIDDPFDGNDGATHEEFTEYFKYSLKGPTIYVCYANQTFPSDQTVISLCGDFYIGTIKEDCIDQLYEQSQLAVQARHLIGLRREIQQYQRLLTQAEKLQSSINERYSNLIGYSLSQSFASHINDKDTFSAAINAKAAELKKKKKPIKLDSILKRSY